MSTNSLNDFILSRDEQNAVTVGVSLLNIRRAAQLVKELPQDALESYCFLKGINVDDNDRKTRGSSLVTAVLRHADNERKVRLGYFDDVDKGGGDMDVQGKVRLLHMIACGQGLSNYRDPMSGYTCFTSLGLLDRGSCCGVEIEGGEVLVGEAVMNEGDGWKRKHRCRHCPYDVDGVLRRKDMMILKGKIGSVRRVREAIRGKWGSKVASVSEDKGSVVQEVAESGDVDDAGEELGQCDSCRDVRISECTRCKGFMFLVSPMPRVCPQCGGKGRHPCMACTGWQPPPRESFYD